MNDLEAMAAALRASGQYRVQRPIQPRVRINDSRGAPTRLGLFVDVETTGLDPTKHEIIELGMIPFSYLPDGLICDIGPPFEQFQEPSLPIPPVITRLTGITKATQGWRKRVWSEGHYAEFRWALTHDPMRSQIQMDLGVRRFLAKALWLGANCDIDLPHTHSTRSSTSA